MKLFRDALVVCAVLLAVYFVTRPSILRSNEERPEMTARLIPSQAELQSFIVVFADGRAKHCLSDVEAREFADSLDNSHYELKWELYNAADEYVAFERKWACVRVRAKQRSASPADQLVAR